MSKTVGLLAIVCICALAASAAPPQEADVQGMYEGTWKDGGKEGKLTARVVALGKQEYQVLAVQHLGGEKTQKVELKGKTDGDKTSPHFDEIDNIIFVVIVLSRNITD